MNIDKKFIITNDQSAAARLSSAGFNLVSNSNGTYTFINSAPKNFNFNEADVKKIVYTDMLTF